MLPRQLMSRDDYDRFMRATFYYDPALRGTPAEEAICKRHEALAEAIARLLKSRGLSSLDDVYVLYDFFRTKLVFLNFVGDTQLIAEDLAAELLQRPEWSDFGFVMSAGDHEPMLLDGDVECITRDRILVAPKESAGDSCGIETRKRLE